jgi:hypothetical protein
MDNNHIDNIGERLILENRHSGKSIMIRHVLAELGKKERIKDIIQSCFNEKNINLSNEELEQEYKLLKTNPNDNFCKYKLEHIIEIRKIDKNI